MENLVGRKARILRASIHGMIGKTVTILYYHDGEDIIVGFPKELGLGWSHSDFPDYGCWFVELFDLKFMSSVTNRKFK